jgi:hypothetical protein
MPSRLVVPLLLLSLLQALTTAGAQIAVTCAAPAGVPPGGITVTSTPPSVTVKWIAVTGARGYAVARRNPDGSCWNLTPSGTISTSIEDPIPVIPGTYQYQVAVMSFTGTTGVSQYVPFTVAAPATTTTVASRSFNLVGFTVVGTTAAVASRTFGTPGFTVTGTNAPVASRTFTTSGFTVVGTTATVASRTFLLTGFTASGTATGSGKKKP